MGIKNTGHPLLGQWVWVDHPDEASYSGLYECICETTHLSLDHLGQWYYIRHPNKVTSCALDIWMRKPTSAEMVLFNFF